MVSQSEYQHLEQAPEKEKPGHRTSAADYLINARDLSQQIVDRSRRQADEILADAQTRADEIVARARAEAEEILTRAREEAEELREQSAIPNSEQERTVRCVEEAFSKLRQLQQDSIDLLNAQWQQFLCGLYTGEDAGEETPEETVPADLSARVSAIADAVEALENGEK